MNNKILYGIIAALVAVILLGTVIGLKQKKTQTPQVLLQQGKAVNLSKPANTEVSSYYEIGTIRIVTAGTKDSSTGSVMVVNPWLEYPEGDTVFYEEIARKRGVIKGIFSNYFSTHSKEELLTITEVNVEQELRTLINQQLSLGKIQGIYFTDYIFLD